MSEKIIPKMIFEKISPNTTSLDQHTCEVYHALILSRILSNVKLNLPIPLLQTHRGSQNVRSRIFGTQGVKNIFFNISSIANLNIEFPYSIENGKWDTFQT